MKFVRYHADEKSSKADENCLLCLADVNRPGEVSNRNVKGTPKANSVLTL
jgi:hypothetical protein